MTRARFDDLLFPAVVAIGAAALAFPLYQYRSLPVDLTYLAVFVGGGLTVVLLQVCTIAALLRLEAKRQDRANIALSEGHRSFHGSNV